MTTVDPFDLSQAPLGEPLSIVIGQTAIWARELNIDPALFSVRYVLRRETPVADETLSQEIAMAHVTGARFAADLAPADTSGWLSGDFIYDLIVTRTSDSRERVVDSGEFKVFSTQDDRRSHAQVMLDKIESLIENRADNDVESYSIKSRSITKMSMSELTKWRDYYRREIANQPRDAGLFQAARPNNSSIRTRLT